MPNVVVVSKQGEVSHHNVKNPTFEQLYKRAGSKTGSNFFSLASWTVELNSIKYNLLLFGKKSGKSNEVNKYAFPPPINSQINYGNIVIINVEADVLSVDNDQLGISIPVLDLTEDEWNKISAYLFTKPAILPSDLVKTEADDDEIASEVCCDEPEEEEIEPPLKKTMKKKGGGAKKNKKNDVSDECDLEMTNEEKMDVITNESIYMTDELEEEPYI